MLLQNGETYSGTTIVYIKVWFLIKALELVFCSKRNL